MGNRILLNALRRAAAALLLIPTLCGGTLSTPDAGEVDTADTVDVPILMYHSVLERENGNTYCIGSEAFRADLCYLKEHGYETVLVSDLVDWAQAGKELPEKPVVITLDDGYLNGLTAVLPVLEELDMKAVISVVGSYTERGIAENDPDPRYAYLTWEDIRTLAQSGRVEIGSHTYNMHNLEGRKGCACCPGEGECHYQDALRADLSHLQALLTDNCGVTPLTFAYPYGAVSQASLPVLKELGFQAALTCDEHINTLTGDPEELYHLGRFNRPSGEATWAFMARVGLT